MNKIQFCIFAILITISFAYPNLMFKRDFLRAMKNQETDYVRRQWCCWHHRIVDKNDDKIETLKSVKDPTHIFGLQSAKTIQPEKNDHTGDDHVGASDNNGFGAYSSFLDDPFYFDENYQFWNKFRIFACYFIGQVQSRRINDSSTMLWAHGIQSGRYKNERSFGGIKTFLGISDFERLLKPETSSEIFLILNKPLNTCMAVIRIPNHSGLCSQLRLRKNFTRHHFTINHSDMPHIPQTVNFAYQELFLENRNIFVFILFF